MSELTNLILFGDSYKTIMWDLYDDFKEMYNYCESRGGDFSDITVFGLQALVKKYLLGNVITVEQVEEAKKFFDLHFARKDVFNYDGWMYIAKNLKGHLPIEISALPEGTTVPVKTPIMTYINTDPKCGWLVGYLEPLLFKVWSPSTICTLSRHIKKVLYEGLQTSGTPENIKYLLTDFSCRGVSSNESAEFGGGAHLVNFEGSDNVPGICFVREYYSKDKDYMPAIGVRATEHSIMTQRGKAGESEIVKKILTKYPDGIVAMVADSYNVFEFAEKILGEQFYTEVVKHEGIIVVRPDSGPPIDTMMKLLWILGEKFGWIVNSKGYRLLNHVRTLQGDGNNFSAIYNMVKAVTGAVWSLDNLGTFGIGGALAQAPTRDTLKMAIKLSSVTDATGNWKSIQKDPITDPGKYSKAGRFSVVKENGRYLTKILNQGEIDPNNLLRPIYRNGKLLIDEDFELIRSRAKIGIEN